MYNAKDAVADAKDAKKGIEEVTDNMCDVARNAGRKMRGMLDCATDELSDATDTVSTQIRKNPVQASLIALGAGFLLGALFRK